MNRGYLKLWRKSLDTAVFHNPELWRMWSWCLMKTSYKERFIPFVIGKGKISVKVLPGQFIFGRNRAAEFLGDSPSTVWKRMKKLESMGCISIQSDRQYSTVTICNWDEYQADEEEKEQASDRQVTAEEQLSDSRVTTEEHKQEGKEGKEGKKTIEEPKAKVFNPMTSKPSFLSEKDLQDIIEHRAKHKNKPVKTERSFLGIYKQLEIAMTAGHSIESCLDKWFTRGWASFDASWMENGNASNVHPQSKQIDKRSSDALELLSRLK